MITMILDLIVAILLLILMIIFSKTLLIMISNFIIPEGEVILWDHLINSFFNQPQREGIFVTMMIVTILIPTIIHFIMSLVWIMFGFIPHTNQYSELLKKNYTDKNKSPLIHDQYVAFLFLVFSFISCIFTISIIKYPFQYSKVFLPDLFLWLKSLDFQSKHNNYLVLINFLVIFLVIFSIAVSRLNRSLNVFSRQKAVKALAKERFTAKYIPLSNLGKDQKE